MKNNKSIVYYIAIAYTALFFIGLIVCIALLALQFLDWITFILYIISGVVQIILLWSLENAIDRIGILENLLIEKKVIEEDEVYKLDDEVAVENSEVIESSEAVSFCPNCGFQIFPEDEICPNCKCKIDRQEDTKE